MRLCTTRPFAAGAFAGRASFAIALLASVNAEALTQDVPKAPTEQGTQAPQSRQTANPATGESADAKSSTEARATAASRAEAADAITNLVVRDNSGLHYLDPTTGARGATVPGSEDVDTFCWDEFGEGFYVTRGSSLQWIPKSAGQTSRVIVDGFAQIRFPDVVHGTRTGTQSGTPDLAFAARSTADASSPWEVWLLLRETGTLRRLGPGYDPCWSNDGSRLFFERHDPGTMVYVWHRKDDQIIPLVDSPDRHYTPQFGRLANTETLAFSRNGDLLCGAPDGTGLRRISATGGYNRFPTFAPDGNAVVYFREESKGLTVITQLLRYDRATQKTSVLVEGFDGQLTAFAPFTSGR